jgi:hypothetical protein
MTIKPEREIVRWSKGRLLRYQMNSKRMEVIRLWGPKAGYWTKSDGQGWKGGDVRELHALLHGLIRDCVACQKDGFNMVESEELPAILRVCSDFEDL